MATKSSSLSPVGILAKIGRDRSSPSTRAQKCVELVRISIVRDRTILYPSATNGEEGGDIIINDFPVNVYQVKVLESFRIL